MTPAVYPDAPAFQGRRCIIVTIFVGKQTINVRIYRNSRRVNDLNRALRGEVRASPAFRTVNKLGRWRGAALKLKCVFFDIR